MFDAQYVFGPATRLQAQAIGEPGHRKFRLLIESDDGRAAALWVEKEQLQALGLAVEQLLAEFQGRLAARLPRQPAVETFPPNPTVDFKVGRLALGQDESELESGPRYVLLVYDLEGSGSEEEELAAAMRALHCTKPVYALIAGRTAREGITMGHAGAIVDGNVGTIASKTEALAGAGAQVFTRIRDLADAVAVGLGKTQGEKACS